MSSTTRVRSLVAIALCFLARVALAQSQPELDEAARVHFERGRAAFQADRYDEALREFDESYRLSGRPALQFNLALCHERLGDRDGAIAAFRRYLDTNPTATDRADAETHLRRLTALAATSSVAATAAATPPPERPRRRWVWGVAAAGAALVIAGVAVGVALGVRATDEPSLPPVTLR